MSKIYDLVFLKMLLVLLLVVTSVQADGIKAPDECPTCEKWLGNRG